MLEMFAQNCWMEIGQAHIKYGMSLKYYSIVHHREMHL